MAEEKKVSSQQAATEVAESSDFAALLNKQFRPKSDRAQEEISSAVETLAEFVLKDRIGRAGVAERSWQADPAPDPQAVPDVEPRLPMAYLPASTPASAARSDEASGGASGDVWATKCIGDQVPP